MENILPYSSAILPKPLEVPDLTTAIIEQQIPQLSMKWAIGTQMATQEGKPYARTYASLNFPNTPSTVNRIDLGSYSEDYEGDFYYRVASTFIETTYSSIVSQSDSQGEDFLRWRRIKETMRQEKVYTGSLNGSLVWNRPSIPTDTNNPTIDPYYLPISNQFVLPLIKVGEAIKARVVVEPDSEIEVRLKANPSESGEVVSGSFYLTKPFIEITLINVINSSEVAPAPGTVVSPNGIGTSHHKITINFYGKFKWATVAPSGTLEQKTLIHPVSATLQTRLKPPGQPQFPDNFWNSDPDNITLEGFDKREGISTWA